MGLNPPGSQFWAREGQEGVWAMANHVTGLSDFSDGMFGFAEERKAVKFWCFEMGWFGG